MGPHARPTRSSGKSSSRSRSSTSSRPISASDSGSSATKSTSSPMVFTIRPPWPVMISSARASKPSIDIGQLRTAQRTALAGVVDDVGEPDAHHLGVGVLQPSGSCVPRPSSRSAAPAAGATRRRGCAGARRSSAATRPPAPAGSSPRRSPPPTSSSRSITLASRPICHSARRAKLRPSERISACSSWGSTNPSSLSALGQPQRLLVGGGERGDVVADGAEPQGAPPLTGGLDGQVEVVGDLVAAQARRLAEQVDLEPVDQVTVVVRVVRVVGGGRHQGWTTLGLRPRGCPGGPTSCRAAPRRRRAPRRAAR